MFSCAGSQSYLRAPRLFIRSGRAWKWISPGKRIAERRGREMKDGKLLPIKPPHGSQWRSTGLRLKSSMTKSGTQCCCGLLTQLPDFSWVWPSHPKTSCLWWLYFTFHVCLVSKSCLTLCNPMDCSPPGSSVHGIFQARILECVAIFFPRRIFPTQGLNLHLLHWQADSLLLSNRRKKTDNNL